MEIIANSNLNYMLASLALLTLICLLSSKISSFLNMPCLLLFLAVGMLFGNEGFNRVAVDFGNKMHTTMVNYIGSAAMAFILFSGGLDTNWKSIKPVFKTGTILSSLGVLLTAFFTGGLFYGICRLSHQNLSFAWCLLLGSVISSTDAAAVFSILRSRSVSLKGELQPLLEYESGSNDPMAAFLTIFMIDIVQQEVKIGTSVPLIEYLYIVPNFLWKMALGAGAGYALARFFVFIYNKINFEYNGLYYVLGVDVVLTAYSLTETFSGNGFMAVYVAGIVMGNSHFVYHNGVGRFFDGLAWMMQVILFTMLGLLSNPSELCKTNVLFPGLIIAFCLMFVARPLATLLCMWRSKFSIQERLLVSWVGLRGGAPIMLATFPLMKGINDSQVMFNIVFFIVITSVLLQGMTIMPFAKLLHLNAPLRAVPRIPLTFEETGDDSSTSQEVVVTSHFEGKTLAEIKLPGGALVLLIRRDSRFIVPRGNTILMADDVLTLMGSPQALEQSVKMLHE